MANTPNMDILLPTVSFTQGALWASEVNEALQTIDAHDHSDGKGVPITPAGMTINDDLNFDNNQIQNAKSVGMFTKAAADITHLGSMQVVGGNVWFVNTAGAAIQLTSGSSVISTGSGVLTPSVVASYPYTILTSDAQAVLIIDTSAARTLNLPSASTPMFVGVKDGIGAASTNTISVVPDTTDLIDNVNSTYTIQEDFGMRGFLSDGVSKWYVV